MKTRVLVASLLSIASFVAAGEAPKSVPIVDALPTMPSVAAPATAIGAAAAVMPDLSAAAVVQRQGASAAATAGGVLTALGGAKADDFSQVAAARYDHAAKTSSGSADVDAPFEAAASPRPSLLRRAGARMAAGSASVAFAAAAATPAHAYYLIDETITRPPSMATLATVAAAFSAIYFAAWGIGNRGFRNSEPRLSKLGHAARVVGVGAFSVFAGVGTLVLGLLWLHPGV